MVQAASREGNSKRTLHPNAVLTHDAVLLICTLFHFFSHFTEAAPALLNA